MAMMRAHMVTIYPYQNADTTTIGAISIMTTEIDLRFATPIFSVKTLKIATETRGEVTITAKIVLRITEKKIVAPAHEITK